MIKIVISAMTAFMISMVAACTESDFKQPSQSEILELAHGTPGAWTTAEGDFAFNPELRPLLDHFAATDYSEFVAARTSAFTAKRMCGPFQSGEDLDPATLTAKEQKLVFGMVSGSGVYNLAHVHNLGHECSKEIGRWPRDAKELLAWLWKNQPAEAERINDLAPAAQYGELYSMVNPVTGKFYESFQAEAWSPGGINIVELRTKEEVKAAFGNQAGGDRFDYPSVEGAWMLKVWSESPGKLLGQHPILAENPALFHLNPPAGAEVSEGLPIMEQDSGLLKSRGS